jgi:hypothetical protein
MAIAGPSESLVAKADGRRWILILEMEKGKVTRAPFSIMAAASLGFDLAVNIRLHLSVSLLRTCRMRGVFFHFPKLIFESHHRSNSLSCESSTTRILRDLSNTISYGGDAE